MPRAPRALETIVRVVCLLALAANKGVESRRHAVSDLAEDRLTAVRIGHAPFVKKDRIDETMTS